MSMAYNITPLCNFTYDNQLQYILSMASLCFTSYFGDSFFFAYLSVIIINHFSTDIWQILTNAYAYN
jgi:hypothetical protein